MTPPLLPTKLQLTAPRPGLVLRPRLVQQLNAGLDGKLTLISASTGFGKTTLSILLIQKTLPLALMGGFHTLLNGRR